MLNRVILPAVTAALLVLALPAEVDAYGAAHVGYTHVGSNGVYHTGATAARGPSGGAATTRTTAAGAGGGVYHAGAGGVATPYGGAAAAGGYHYTPAYGGAAVGGARYGYVR